jgi:hypothetical protein
VPRDGEPPPGEERLDGREQRVRARGRHADGEGAPAEGLHRQHEEPQLGLDGLQAPLCMDRLRLLDGQPFGRLD